MKKLPRITRPSRRNTLIATAVGAVGGVLAGIAYWGAPQRLQQLRERRNSNGDTAAE